MHHPTDRIIIPRPLLHQSWSTGWNNTAVRLNDGGDDDIIIIILIIAIKIEIIIIIIYQRAHALNTFYLWLYGVRYCN